MSKSSVRPAAGQCDRCDGPMVAQTRNPNALLCARCLRRPGACSCAKIVS